MSNISNNKYTFWRLLENYSIKIPIIQRDYVQGREKEKRVRENFLNAIYKKLKNNDELHLDFIYGVIKNDKFIPLDGQQRLTTLFLLHYYLALKENKFEEFQEHLKKEKDIKFTYETRESSKEFCEQLIYNKIELNGRKISKIIEDENWFFSKWNQDPTISSMLIMLNDIQNIYKDDNLFDNLKTNITFSFLEPEKLNIKNSDELYIKMNSRGKPLNEFENFKSYFTSFLADEKKIKFDNEWFDIFWKSKTTNQDNKELSEEIIEKEIFGAYLNFFKNITAFYSEEFNEVDIFNFKYVFQKTLIDEISKILDCLIDYNDNLVYELEIRKDKDFNFKIFQDFITIESSKAEYEKRLRFYALMKFFINIGKVENNETLFKQWMRVCLNIIHNTLDDRKNYETTIKIINDLSIELSKNNNFYEQLKDLEISKTDRFLEEKEKAEIICSNSKEEWEQELIEAEKNWYLDGQVKFLIDYANKDLEKFKEYRDKFIALWNFTRNNKYNQTLIHRALLTFKKNENDELGYIKSTKMGNKYTFCTFGTDLREKTENWRKVFESWYFQEFLKKFQKEQLEKIINSYEFNCNDWKSYFINPNKNWTPIEDTRNYQIIWRDKNTICLNQGNTRVISWGWKRRVELYTWYLFKEKFGLRKEKDRKIRWRIESNKIFKPFKLSYYQQSSDSLQPCIVLDEWENYEINIIFDQEIKKFQIEFLDKNNKKLSNNIKKILEKYNFEENGNKYDIPIYELKDNYNHFTLCKQNNLIIFLEELTKNLIM